MSADDERSACGRQIQNAGRIAEHGRAVPASVVLSPLLLHSCLALHKR